MPRFLDRLMGRERARARKSQPMSGFFALHGQPGATWTPRDYATLARQGYQSNPVAYRAVRLIADAAASVPWLLYRGAAEEHEHPLLALLAAPNPAQSGAQFCESLYGHLHVAGNAYLEAVSVAGEVRELHLLRPDRVRVVAGSDGWPEGYDYTVGGQTMRYARDGAGQCPILHLKLFHPLDDHYGLSPLEAALTALDIHNAGAAWNKALLDNAARPSGALVYAGPDGASSMSEAQYDRVKSELESQYQGARNAGRPLLLEGGLSWTAMSLSPQDMDFIAARHVAAREIALAFGVPPMLLGIPGDNTYANYREAQLALWRQTVIPLLAKTAQALSAWLGPRFEPGLRLDMDLDQVSALSAEREQLWTRLTAANFLTEAEKRAAAGYGPKDGSLRR